MGKFLARKRGKNFMKRKFVPFKTFRCRKLRKKATKEELLLWTELRKPLFRKYNFRRQHSVSYYYPDFCSRSARLIVELDGWHHRKIKQRNYDKRRTLDLNLEGFKVIRFWNIDVIKNLNVVLFKIWRECKVRESLTPLARLVR
jgi:very-short-patch-repair endonuclease